MDVSKRQILLWTLTPDPLSVADYLSLPGPLNHRHLFGPLLPAVVAVGFLLSADFPFAEILLWWILWSWIPHAAAVPELSFKIKFLN